MKRLIIVFIFGLIFTHSTNGQLFSKKYFVSTEWFTDNKDSAFFKKDTLIFIQYSNLYAKERNLKLYRESEIELLGHGEFVKFQFNKNGNMHFWRCYYHQGTKSGIGERTWKFDNSKNQLITYYKDKTEFIFQPLFENDVQFIRDYQNYSDTMTTKQLTLLKIY